MWKNHNILSLKEKELYSKACVAGSIKFSAGKEIEGDIEQIENDKFSCSLATILARDKEVVAVYLKILSTRCEVYISKNSEWYKEDNEYINRIHNLLKNISQNTPINLSEAWKRDDVKTLFTDVMTYCSAKLEGRVKKLINDIIKDKHNDYVRSFIERAKIDIENVNKVKKYHISRFCCEYYKEVKGDSTIPKKFLKHLKKVGSYVGSLIDIIKYAININYKPLFSRIELHKLDPIIVNDQPLFSWKSIIQESIIDPNDYEAFKKSCLNDYVIKQRLKDSYGGVDEQLDREINQKIYLHAELNILTEVINQNNKHRVFIATSKRCCHLCELYINFARIRGYYIVTTGTHNKLYHKWKLPYVNGDNYRRESLSYIIESLEQTISEEVMQHYSTKARTDSDGVSVGSNDYVDYEKIDAMCETIFICKDD